MKGNGLKIGLAVFFLVLSGWYLFPSFRNYFIQQKLDSLEGQELAQYEQENYATIREVEESALKLGLDLQGGMHVGLEVRVEALISELATDKDQAFEDILAAATQQVSNTDQSIIETFINEFESRDPEARLSRYFRNEAEGITRRSTNADVAAYLQRQTDDAVTRAIEIIRQRVDRFGVTEPSIQKQGTRRIIVELPGVTDAERVRNLLRGTARLEFRLMADPDDLRRSLQQVADFFEETETEGTPQGDIAQNLPQPADTASAGGDTTDLAAAPDTATGLAPLAGSAAATNPLLAVMQPVGQGVQFGLVAEQDTAEVNRLLSQPGVEELLPPGVTLMYTSGPVASGEDGRELYYLLGVREEIELTGDVITDARVNFDELNRAQVDMTMNAEGARDWARITGANVNKPVAIVLDDIVFSYPTVINRIPSGRSNITGLDSREEAEDIVTILKSGALPAPVDIVEEQTVGPSLGAASIRAGLNSIIAGLFLVAVFMIFYYRTAGIIANLALMVNMIFILGILAAFNATLTLPGMAGIVLTIGMAVDANVLIFERIREELATGKTLKAAVDTGYSKALSAIFDGNITTFFIGVILYSFGVGPIQGFAVTLMAGIMATMFSAIVITRLFFDYMVSERRIGVSFG